MKTILCGDAASDSGSFGFSEAWPLHSCQFLAKRRLVPFGRKNLPSSPHSVDAHTLCNIDNEFDVGIVVVVGTARNLSMSVSTVLLALYLVESCGCSLLYTYLNIFVCHPDVVCVGSQIFRSSHDSELNGTLVAKGLVSPSSDGSDLFDCGDTVVCNEDLVEDSISSNDTLCSFCCGLLTFVMTVCPSFAATKSFTLDGGAWLSSFPPMKCVGKSCLAA